MLFLMDGLIVRSETFSDFKVIGNPYDQLSRLDEWLADELVYVDITRKEAHVLRTNDRGAGDADVVVLLRNISKRAFMPLTFGGRIRTLEDVDRLIHNGADKVILNSAAWRNPQLVTAAAQKHGSQAVMVGIDLKQSGGRHIMHIDQGRTPVEDDIADYARRMQEHGAGEILVNSINRDGTGDGLDIAGIRLVAEAVSVPVIACGGVGTVGDFRAAIDEAGASAVAAGNIFHFTENAYKRVKTALRDAGYNVRYPYPA